MKHSNNIEKFYFEIDKYEDNFTLINDRFCFELKDEKGYTYLRSLPYTDKTDCQEGIISIIRNSKNEERFDVVPGPYETWFISLNTPNGEVIAICPSFETKKEVLNLIKDLNCLSFETPVVDNTKIKN